MAEERNQNTAAPEQDLSEILKVRRDKLAALRADLAVAFDDAAPRCGCPVLPLVDGALRVRYAAPLPQEAAGWETRQLICALFAAGALAKEDIAVKEVKFPADRGQNANLS